MTAAWLDRGLFIAAASCAIGCAVLGWQSMPVLTTDRERIDVGELQPKQQVKLDVVLKNWSWRDVELVGYEAG